VQSGECGLLWERGELAETVRAFERDGVTWSETEIATYAATNWSIGRFEREMQAVIDEATETTAVEVDLETPARGFECPIPQSAATDGGGGTE
jgi:hypothetical protein